MARLPWMRRYPPKLSVITFFTGNPNGLEVLLHLDLFIERYPKDGLHRPRLVAEEAHINQGHEEVQEELEARHRCVGVRALDAAAGPVLRLSACTRSRKRRYELCVYLVSWVQR